MAEHDDISIDAVYNKGKRNSAQQDNPIITEKFGNEMFGDNQAGKSDGSIVGIVDVPGFGPSGLLHISQQQRGTPGQRSQSNSSRGGGECLGRGSIKRYIFLNVFLVTYS